MEYLIVILSVSTVLCESSSKARVPLVDAVHAPLVAELDITGVKNELKEYIDVQVEKQVNQTSDGKIKTVVNEKVSELKSEMTEDFLNCLNQTEHACDVQVDALLRRFTVQNKLIEYFLKNKNKELKHNIKNIEDWKRPLIKDSELKSYFEELKSNLTSTQEKDLCKEKQRCFNGGTCQTNSSTFYCICTKGYIGENCQYTGLSTVLSACEKGWAEFQGECLQFSQSPKTWLDAEADCRRHKAYLATDDNEAKHNFISQFLNVFTSWGINHFWLGASDYAFENRWQWLETGGVVTRFTAWGVGEPNGNMTQNCLATSFNGTDLIWIDEKCDVHQPHHPIGLNYICEKPDPTYNPGSIIG